MSEAPPNPLRDPGDRRLPRMAGPCALVMFGVTGDLSRKKLLPAVYDLANRGLLSPGFGLVGFARCDWAAKHSIAEVLQAVTKAKVSFGDLHTEQSSLEDIFMGLVKS